MASAFCVECHAQDLFNAVKCGEGVESDRSDDVSDVEVMSVGGVHLL